MTKPPYIINLPKFGNKHRGLAFYPFIFIAGEPLDHLVKHEKVHIKQQLRGWLIGFYVKYLYYNIRYGYWNNPYEVEARQGEK